MKKDKNNIEDIEKYAYVRFLCLLDFFDISIRELCEVYELGTKHREKSNGYIECPEEDWITKNINYFKYHLPKHENNHSAMKDFINAFIDILEVKEYESISYLKEMFIWARLKILEDKKYEIIYDYQKFYLFFSRIVDCLEEYIPSDMEFPDMPEIVKYKAKGIALFKAKYIFTKAKINFNEQLINEIYKREIAFPTNCRVNNVPIFNYWSDEVVNNFWTIVDILYLNWSFFERIYENKELAEYFIYLLKMNDIKKEQCKLLKRASLINGDRLLKKVTDYAYILHFAKGKRISKNVLKKFKDELFSKGVCGAFWFNHSVELTKLKRDKNTQLILETLFYYACIYDEVSA